MKNLTILFFVICGILGYSQKLANINSGESITYRVHYGPINAGYATLTSTRVDFQGKPHLYVKGVGKSAGAVNTFFKVNDVYESFIDYNTGLPSYYVRNVSEGSYTQHLQTVFNHSNHTLILTDKEKKSNNSQVIKSVKGVQDMLSAFYVLRSMDKDELKVGTVKNLNVWISDELFPFSIRVAGRETIKTKFGKVDCLRIVPIVKSGRVFKDKEGVTIWVTNDNNHLPVAIKAELAVGSLKASLDSYKNVKYPLALTK